jgi:hypothetical protein
LAIVKMVQGQEGQSQSVKFACGRAQSGLALTGAAKENLKIKM